jgi:DNA repair exonuclease SbcCD nuclease subunit
MKPDTVILGGDLFDLFSFNRFCRKIIARPKDEIEDARKVITEVTTYLRRKIKGVRIVILTGNHDARALAAAYDKDPAIAALLEMLGVQKLWDFDGCETIYDPRQEFLLNGIVFMHGYRPAGKHYLHNLRPTVTGHTHTLQLWKAIPIVDPITQETRFIWEMNCGYLGDPDSVPMSYPKQKYQHYVHGFGWIDEHGPRPIAL